MMSCQHLDSSTERDMALMVISSSLWNPLASFCVLANRLVHLGLFFVGLQVHMNVLCLVPLKCFS